MALAQMGQVPGVPTAPTPGWFAVRAALRAVLTTLIADVLMSLCPVHALRLAAWEYAHLHTAGPLQRHAADH